MCARLRTRTVFLTGLIPLDPTRGEARGRVDSRWLRGRGEVAVRREALLCDASRACLLPDGGLCFFDDCLASQQARSHSPDTRQIRPPHHHRSPSPQHNPSHASPAIAQGSIISYQHPLNVRLPSLPTHRPHRCKTLSRQERPSAALDEDDGDMPQSGRWHAWQCDGRQEL